MTEENQRKLYHHFLSLIDNPRVGLVGQENRVIIDKAFIVKQAKEQVKEILRVYPHFAKPDFSHIKEPEKKETKSKKGK